MERKKQTGTKGSIYLLHANKWLWWRSGKEQGKENPLTLIPSACRLPACFQWSDQCTVCPDSNWFRWTSWSQPRVCTHRSLGGAEAARCQSYSSQGGSRSYYFLQYGGLILSIIRLIESQGGSKRSHFMIVNPLPQQFLSSISPPHVYSPGGILACVFLGQTFSTSTHLMKMRPLFKTCWGMFNNLPALQGGIQEH